MVIQVEYADATVVTMTDLLVNIHVFSANIKLFLALFANDTSFFLTIAGTSLGQQRLELRCNILVV